MGRIEKIARIIPRTHMVEIIDIDSMVKESCTLDDFFDAKGEVFLLNQKLLEKYLVARLKGTGFTEITSGKMERNRFRQTVVPKLGLIELKVRKSGKQTVMRPFELKFLADASELRKVDAKYESMSDLEVAASMTKEAYQNNLIKSTLSLDAITSWKTTVFPNRLDATKVNEPEFRLCYPTLDIPTYDFAQKAYFGGWCFLSKTGESYKGSGRTYDVNSLYPSAMATEGLPSGRPVIVKGAPQKVVKFNNKLVKNTLFITEFKVSGLRLKEKMYPFAVAQENSFEQGPGRYDMEGTLTFNMTNVEYELFLETYEFDTIDFIETHHYIRTENMFNKYINYWMDIKANSTGATRQLAKLMLNNLYGRFGYKIRKSAKQTTDEGTILVETVSPSSGVYLPVAVFTTAYGRVKTVRAANANYEDFLYADTDSIHLKNSYKKQSLFQKLFKKEPELVEVKGIEIHDSNIGAWKLEMEFTESNFLGLKTYCEFDGSEWHFTIAGLPSTTEFTVVDFYAGSNIPIMKKVQTTTGWREVQETFTIMK